MWYTVEHFKNQLQSETVGGILSIEEFIVLQTKYIVGNGGSKLSADEKVAAIRNVIIAAEEFDDERRRTV
ncbi:hypothetical protein ACFQ88_23150 [Paenibacillus sp. NPDC056579]|uniref:hypothetical protein n=1 Tax=Paenibacillus sp. NPDC056579 TaxID=3345871 RepID=UPI0036B6766F